MPLRWVLPRLSAIWNACTAPASVLSQTLPETEAPAPTGLEDQFCCQCLVLPDHRIGRPPDIDELQQALCHLKELRLGPRVCALRGSDGTVTAGGMAWLWVEVQSHRST